MSLKKLKNYIRGCRLFTIDPFLFEFKRVKRVLASKLICNNHFCFVFLFLWKKKLQKLPFYMKK